MLITIEHQLLEDGREFVRGVIALADPVEASCCLLMLLVIGSSGIANL